MATRSDLLSCARSETEAVNTATTLPCRSGSKRTNLSRASLPAAPTVPEAWQALNATEATLPVPELIPLLRL